MKEKNGRIYQHFTALPSTNVYLKEKRHEEKNYLVTADMQTEGRGTKGRNFSSNTGGVYLSRLTFYEEFLAKDAFQIMTNTATAVCETLREFGLQPVVKWPNDVFVGDKKICGILIENSFSGNQIVSSIVGIGLNVCNVLPEELQNIATTMRLETGKTFDVERVRNALIDNLEKSYDMEKYLSYIGYLGREVMLSFGDERIPATLLSVDDEGGLWVKIQENERRFTSAEVRILV